MPQLSNAQQTIDNIYSSLKEINKYMSHLHSMNATPLARQHHGIRENIEFLSASLMIDSMKTFAEHQDKILASINSITDTIAIMQETIKSNHTVVIEKIKNIEKPAPKVQPLEPVELTESSWSTVAKRTKPSTNQPKTTTTTNPATPTPSQEKALTATQTINPNPDTSHHPLRLIVQFHPDSILDKDREDPETVIQLVNSTLGIDEKAKYLKVIAVRYNTQGNLILSTRADQTTAELINYASLFIPHISKGYQTTVRVNKQWFKIQVDGVSTRRLTIGGKRTV